MYCGRQPLVCHSHVVHRLDASALVTHSQQYSTTPCLQDMSLPLLHKPRFISNTASHVLFHQPWALFHCPRQFHLTHISCFNTTMTWCGGLHICGLLSTEVLIYHIQPDSISTITITITTSLTQWHAQTSHRVWMRLARAWATSGMDCGYRSAVFCASCGTHWAGRRMKQNQMVVSSDAVLLKIVNINYT